MSRHGKRRTGSACVTSNAVNTHVMESLRDTTGHRGTSTTKFLLNRFISDFYSRRRATVEEHWTRSLRFLSTELANAAFTRDGAEVAAMAAGTADTELQVEQVVLRIHPAPEAPHGATADFDLGVCAAEAQAAGQDGSGVCGDVADWGHDGLGRGVADESGWLGGRREGRAGVPRSFHRRDGVGHGALRRPGGCTAA